MNDNLSEDTQTLALPTLTNRGIDIAMADERPAKLTIRQLWLEQAIVFNDLHPEDDVPLYLTLSGAEAKDIRLLAENHIIQLTEVGGIAQESMDRVVAVEKNQQAVLKLRKLLPGIQVVTQDFNEIVAGESLTTFPQNRNHQNFCCAKIVNLDLQSSLTIKVTDLGIVFPILNWIHKLSILHTTRKPGINWCLCLTLNATIPNPEVILPIIQQFLKENYHSSPEFEVSCRNLLGEELQNIVIADDPINIDQLTQEQQQKILMIFVPKKISRLVHSQNWHVRTLSNLCYGGNDNHAPMVTWILAFEWDERAVATPNTVYMESINKILLSAGRINDNGVINNYN